jgi:hypothetical protein
VPDDAGIERHGWLVVRTEAGHGVASSEVCHRARRADRAALDDHDVRGELGDVVEVVRDDQHRQRHLPLQGGQFVAQRLAQRPVDCRKRLVEQQHGGVARKRSGQGHALLLAAGKGGGPASRQFLQVHELEQRCDATGPFRGRHMAQGQGELLTYVEVREEGVVLEDHAHRSAMRRQEDPGGGVGPVLATTGNQRFFGPVQPRDGAQYRGLAAARRAEQGGDGPRRRAEFDRHRKGRGLSEPDAQFPGPRHDVSAHAPCAAPACWSRPGPAGTVPAARRP